VSKPTNWRAIGLVNSVIIVSFSKASLVPSPCKARWRVLTFL